MEPIYPPVPADHKFVGTDEFICGYSGSKGTAIRNFDEGEISNGTVVIPLLKMGSPTGSPFSDGNH